MQLGSRCNERRAGIVELVNDIAAATNEREIGRRSRVNRQVLPREQQRRRSMTAVDRGLGRQTSRFGIRRNDGACSTAWCVGPSSPSPIESCVNTWMTPWFISAAMRTALRL